MTCTLIKNWTFVVVDIEPSCCWIESLKYGSDLLLYFLWERMEGEVEPNNDHELQGKYLRGHGVHSGFSCWVRTVIIWFPAEDLSYSFRGRICIFRAVSKMFLLCCMNEALFHLYVDSWKDTSLKSYKCWSSSKK